MDLIKQYIIGLKNLYGQVPAEVVVDIYNSHNEEQIGIDDVLVYFDEDMSKQYIYAYKDHFVHETIMQFNDFKSMRKKKADKPYYIPDKDELLRYSDLLYYEKPKQYGELMKIVKKHFFPSDPEKAEMICENMMWKCRDDFRPAEAFELFNTFEVNFKDEKQVNEVLQLVMELSNNVRLWENNGHTHQEKFEKFENQNLRPLPDKPFDYGSVKKEKIGRNNPCPCGFGKKYKKYCLGKDKN